MLVQQVYLHSSATQKMPEPYSCSTSCSTQGHGSSHCCTIRSELFLGTVYTAEYTVIRYKNIRNTVKNVLFWPKTPNIRLNIHRMPNGRIRMVQLWFKHRNAEKHAWQAWSQFPTVPVQDKAVQQTHRPSRTHAVLLLLLKNCLTCHIIAKRAFLGFLSGMRNPAHTKCRRLLIFRIPTLRNLEACNRECVHR